VLVLLGVFALGPLVVLVFNAFKTDAELGSNPLGPPREIALDNFERAWVQGSLGTGLANSALLVAGTVMGVWICAGAAAYAMARLDLPGAGTVTAYLVVVIALPVQLFLVPLFFLWTRLNLYDTLPGLILIYVALNSPFATLLLRAFLLSIPRDIDDAARIDGANEWQLATRVVMPLAWPGFLTVGLVTGLAAYNELLFATTFMSSPENLPISTAFLHFQQGFTRQWGITGAAGLIMIIPVLVLFLLMQRRFIAGLTTGGVKG
jgi:raffinose/stachyose/melibiose transport system permease protein